MTPSPATRSWLGDAAFTFAVAIWIVSLGAAVTSFGFVIAPFAVALFAVCLELRFSVQRAIVGALATATAAWMLWAGLA